MVFDGVAPAVIDLKPPLGDNPVAVDILLSSQHSGSVRVSPLDTKEIVVLGSELASPPLRLENCLSNRDGRVHVVRVLHGLGFGGHLLNERLLSLLVLALQLLFNPLLVPDPVIVMGRINAQEERDNDEDPDKDLESRIILP